MHVFDNAGVAIGVADGTLESFLPWCLDGATPVAIDFCAVTHLQTPQANRALGRVPVNVGREVSLQD